VSDVAIRVENLSKQYRIGARQAGYSTIRETVTDLAVAPLRRLRRLGQPAPPEESIWALKDVSFEVKQGEVVGIIGRNGAGKTTLLKILSRITEPTKGRAEIHGRVGSLLEVGTGFHPELTGRENIYLNGAILGMKRAEIDRKFDEIVDFSGIEKFIDTPVKRYSSGMYVRLAFAVAAHLEPEILLVDEVLAVGDVQFQRKCLGKMGDVAKEGRTVLFVSHNMAAILNLCSLGMLLDEGQVVCQGRISDVVDDYLDRSIVLRSEIRLPQDRSGLSTDFRFRAIRIYDLHGQLSSQVWLSEGFQLEIEYEVLQPMRGSNIGFILWNSRGECVFTSTDVDENPSAVNSVRLPGQYAARCLVAGEYLRHGIYQIDVAASVPNMRMLDRLWRVISVEVVDDGSVESIISQGRQGVIAPSLHWHVRELQKAEDNPSDSIRGGALTRIDL